MTPQRSTRAFLKVDKKKKKTKLKDKYLWGSLVHNTASVMYYEVLMYHNLDLGITHICMYVCIPHVHVISAFHANPQK